MILIYAITLAIFEPFALGMGFGLCLIIHALTMKGSNMNTITRTDGRV